MRFSTIDLIENLIWGGKRLKTGSTARRQRLWPAATDRSALEKMVGEELGVGSGGRWGFELGANGRKR